MALNESQIVARPVPTGGAISLTVSGFGDIAIARSQTGVSGAYMNIYAGTTTPIYIDPGDGLPTTLSSGFTYCYRMTDDNGVTFSNELQTPAALSIVQDDLLPLMQKLLQGGINNLVAPNGVNQIPVNQIVVAMPLTGNPPMPIITINLEVVMQDQVPIGQNFENVDIYSGAWTLTAYAKRVFRISVLALNTKTRDFYRDSIIAIFESLLTTTFGALGLNNTHKFQAFTGQVADAPSGNSPGFYYADIVLELDGTLNIGISNIYGAIDNISITVGYGTGVQDTYAVSGV